MDKKDIIYYVLIALVLFFMIFVTMYLIKNKEMFYEHPFIYGASKMGNVQCSCTQRTAEGLAVFWFNDTDFKSDNYGFVINPWRKQE